MDTVKISNPKLKFTRPLTTSVKSIKKTDAGTVLILDSHSDVEIEVEGELSLTKGQDVMVTPETDEGGVYTLSFAPAPAKKSAPASPKSSSPAHGMTFSNVLA